MVMRAAAAIIGLKLRVVFRYTRLPKRSPFQALTKAKVGAQRGFEDVVAPVEHARLFSLGDLGSVSRGCEERWDSGATRADPLGERSLGAQLDIQLAFQIEPLEGLVLADITGGDLLDLAILQQNAQALAIDTAVVRDDRKIAHAAPVKGRDQVLGNPAQSKTPGHQYRSVADVGDGIVGGGDSFVHVPLAILCTVTADKAPRLRLRARPAPINVEAPGPGDAVIEIHVDALAPGGDAVGRQQGGANDGRVTFVALAAPGDDVRARVVRQKARVAWADLVAVEQSSAVRVPPPCPFFGRCGGCQWQHVDLAAQRAAKRAIVARALRLPDVPLIEPTETGQGYRDRAGLVVGPKGEIGFRARRSHVVVDVDWCLLLGPELKAPLAAVRASASYLPEATEIDLQTGRAGVHVTLRGPTHPGPPIDGERLLAKWRPAGVVGIRVIDGRGTCLAGAPDVDVSEPGGPPLRIPAGGFAQVGRAANAALVEVVLDAMGPAPGALLELYAGSGNFTRHIVGRATRVVACDADAAAASRGRGQVSGATWLHRPPGVVDADTVLVDPPREGLDAENLAAAGKARRRIVYVSCDPQTLARDVERLTRAGFGLKRAVALDLMPHTFHVEVVAVLERV